ncbi:MAG: B3/B4 domain-containing protein [Planctomycetota bacterium]|jgi:DNA/RNA-binding domain of Phe-tRNA-synthetase-like protein
MAQIEIADELLSLIRIAVFEVRGVKVVRDTPVVREEIETCADNLRNEFGDKTIGQVPGIEISRKLYRALGIEPTKTRPSSEALIRRILKEKPFPKVNNLVDALNLASVKVCLSMGLYDMAKISGTVTLRRGGEGEYFKGLGKDRVNVGGRFTLADEEGPFGNPTMDSARTCITEETTDALVVMFAPSELPAAELRKSAEIVSELLKKHAGGDVPEITILPTS